MLAVIQASNDIVSVYVMTEGTATALEGLLTHTDCQWQSSAAERSTNVS